MANRYFFKFFLLFFACYSQMTVSGYAQDFCSVCTKDWTAEFRVAYFHPESSRLKKIYSDGLVDYQFEALKKVYPRCSIWLDVDYLTKKGHSDPLDDPTRMWLIPVTLGASYDLICQGGWKVYLGAGISYVHLKIHDHSHYVKEHLSKGTCGGLFKFGIKKSLGCNFVLDVFCDYALQKFHFSDCSSDYVKRHDLNASGWKIGLGLGYFF